MTRDRPTTCVRRVVCRTTSSGRVTPEGATFLKRLGIS